MSFSLLSLVFMENIQGKECKDRSDPDVVDGLMLIAGRCILMHVKFRFNLRNACNRLLLFNLCFYFVDPLVLQEKEHIDKKRNKKMSILSRCGNVLVSFLN